MILSKKLALLEKLCKEYPNAYVVVGNTFQPVRSELFDFEFMKIASTHNMYKKHNGLPIILTVDEDQRVIYEQFEGYLYFMKEINLKGTKDYQLGVFLFLKSFTNDDEMRQILDACTWYKRMELIHVETWVELMEYGMQPLFLIPYVRKKICAIIHRGKSFSADARTNAQEENEYALSLVNLSEANLCEREPVLFKALEFYHVSLKELKEAYLHIKYSNSSYGPN